MRRMARPLILLAAASTVGACLGTKRPINAGAAPGGVAASPTDPDVESLRASSSGGWKDFYILSPEDSQTEDPDLPLRLVRVAKLHHDRVGIVLDLENRHTEPLDGSGIRASLVDGDERTLPILDAPAATAIPPGTSTRLVWIFNVADAAKGSLEMRLEVPGTKAWPIVFSKQKPPDFKPTPNPNEAPGPGGGGGLGGAPY